MAVFHDFFKKKKKRWLKKLTNGFFMIFSKKKRWLKKLTNVEIPNLFAKIQKDEAIKIRK